MSPVADLTEHLLGTLVAAEQVSARMPSLVAGVVRDGEVVWQGSHGAHTGGPPPGPDLQYRVGSITKTMTAVLILQLRDEGRLELGDRLDAHLPGVGYGDRTLGSLLSHASGMPAEPEGPWWERSPGVAFDDIAAAVDDHEAPFEPHVTHHYSNLGYGLLGEVVARLRQDSWWSQVQRRILEPLGMHRTGYLPAPPAATGYSVHHFAGTLTEEPAQDTGAMAPAGQLWSTVSDLAAYAQVLLGRRPDVLTPDSLTQMRTPQTGTPAVALTDGYGLGLRLVGGGSGALVGHTGSMPGFLAGLFVDPVRGTGAVCLANGTSGMRCEGLPRDLLEALERCEPHVPAPWVPVEHVAAGVAEILGVWHWGNTAFAFSFDGRDVVVRALSSGATTGRYTSSPDGTFHGVAGYHHGETLRVVRDDAGEVSHLVCATFVYTRVPYDSAAPIPGDPPGRD